MCWLLIGKIMILDDMRWNMMRLDDIAKTSPINSIGRVSPSPSPAHSKPPGLRHALGSHVQLRRNTRPRGLLPRFHATCRSRSPCSNPRKAYRAHPWRAEAAARTKRWGKSGEEAASSKGTTWGANAHHRSWSPLPCCKHHGPHPHRWFPCCLSVATAQAWVFLKSSSTTIAHDLELQALQFPTAWKWNMTFSKMALLLRGNGKQGEHVHLPSYSKWEKFSECITANLRCVRKPWCSTVKSKSLFLSK